ncbi:MAG: hypothetical protein ACTTJO_00880 [Metamycoplasmataceae bacterium]
MPNNSYNKYAKFMNKVFYANNNLIHLLPKISAYLGFFILTIYIPFISFIPIIPKLVTVTYLPFIMTFAICNLGFLGALVTGLGFGFSSWLVAIIYGFSIRYQYFDIAVLPRIINALIIYFLYLIFRFKNKPKIQVFIFLSILATILNVVLTVSATYLRHNLIKPIPTVLPFKFWFIRHIPSMIIEPIFAGAISSWTYKFLIFINEQNQNYKKIIY